MYPHLDHHDVVYAERRRRDEREAARWRLAQEVRRPGAPAATLGSLLARAGSAITDEVLDGRDTRHVVLVEALLSELVSAAAQHDRRLAALTPRPGEPVVVAARTLAALAARGDVHDVPIDARRTAVVRDLLRQLGADLGPSPVAGARPAGVAEPGPVQPVEPAGSPAAAGDGWQRSA